MRMVMVRMVMRVRLAVLAFVRFHQAYFPLVLEGLHAPQRRK